MFSQAESILLSFAGTLPLEVFVLVASFFEEIVAPIPSPAVMMLAGSFAMVQERTLMMLVPLALIGAVGKTLGAIVVYVISDKAEDFVMQRFGGFFKVTHADVTAFSERLGTGAKSYFFLTFLRALPVIPSTLLSVGSGLLKIPLPLFIVATFLGSVVRDGFYLYAGYIGTKTLASFVSQSSIVERVIEIAVVCVILFYVAYRVYSRRKSP
jgi:membrane protein DedA with SNARE-associated domain